MERVTRHSTSVQGDTSQSGSALTDWRVAHDQLMQQITLLLTMLGRISQGVFMVDDDGRVSAFNPRVCELLDLTADYLYSGPTLKEITELQRARGDFGPSNILVDANAREYVALLGDIAIPQYYLRKTKAGRVLEVLTQMVPTGGMVRTFTDVTDYIKTQQELKRSSLLLQATQAIAEVGGWEVDVMTDSVFWTDEVYRILDTTPAAFTPTKANTLQFFAPEWIPVIAAASQSAGADKEHASQDLEVEMITAIGRRIWVHTKSMLTVVQGRVVKRTSVIRDITTAKVAQASLRASEELFRQVTSQMPGMVYRLHIAPDGHRQYSFISSGVRELYGLEPEAVMADGKLLHHYRHPDDNVWVEQNVTEVIAYGLPRSIEFRIVLDDGTQKWVQLTSSMASQDATGTVRNGVMLDITARKQAEVALRERDALWKLALESTGDGVWDLNTTTGVKLFSKRCLEMYGYVEGEIQDLAIELDRRIHPDDLAQIAVDRQAHYDGLTPTFINEHRVRCKNGSWKWVLSRGMVISRDLQGKPLRMTGTHTDITSRKNAESLIWHQANFDALTGLPNRRMLRDRIEQDIKRTQQAGQKLAVMFIDLDHFKEVNDTLGHSQGDALLIQAAARIHACVREGDTVARMGGDEFTVVLPALSDVAVVDQIVQSIISTLVVPFCLGADQSFVSASIGITLYPGDATEIDNLFKHADQALYVAKDAGRNRSSYFSPELQVAAKLRASLASDLRGALADGQFWLAYQPIVELATGAIYKAEALIRWQHPTRGLVSPAAFIPLAESSGLINEIGDWVFRQAAAQVAQWRRDHYAQFQVSVNKSPVQFHSNQQSHHLWFDYLKELGLPGQSIVLEITEGLLLDAGSNVSAQLLALRDAGVGVSLDDFGTGYSSLSYLQQYDIDYLKIDQSFVRNLQSASKDMALCNAIIVMAHALGMRVIAEGVETATQRDLLIAAGCDYGQGYLFARPMPAAEFGVFLAGRQ